MKWKEGKNITVKKITKKQKNKRTGQQREITKTEKQESFFNYFANLKEEIDDGEDDDDEAGNINNDNFAMCEDILSVIKESIIPYVVPAYFGVPIPELEEADQDFDEDYEDEDEEYDEDEEDESPAPKKKGGKGGKGGKGKKSGDDADVKGGPNQQECKQN